MTHSRVHEDFTSICRWACALGLFAGMAITGARAQTGAATSSLPHTPHVTKARGSQAMLVVTSGAEVAEEIVEGLANGQLSAIDGALATAFAQIVLSGGSWVSFAGILNAAHYDPETGRVEMLDAGFSLPAGEIDPWSIPATGTPSGRGTLTPGFMAGAEAAHARHGQAAWASLFQPAIARAREGIAVTETLARLIEFRRDVLMRTREARGIFAPDGTLLRVGQTLQQTALADLLQSIARDGAAEMRSGPWAEAFVARVQAEGGHITLSDLSSYTPIWQSPLSITYAGAEVLGPALPQMGGLCLVEALARLGDGTLRDLGHYAEVPEALIRVIRASHLCYVRYLDADPEAAATRLADPAPQGPIAPIPLADRLAGPPGSGDHSDVVVAVDRAGRIAVICHSINTTAWGATGLFVQGVSVPDSGAFQQSLLARVGPGARVPNALSPVIVLREAKPIVAMGGIGGSVSEVMLQATVNLLDFDLSPDQAVRAPMVLRAIWPGVGLFQIILITLAVLIFVPTLILSAEKLMGGSAPFTFGLLVLTSTANLAFALAIYAAWRYGCRACLSTIDLPVVLIGLGALTVVAALVLLVTGTGSGWLRVGVVIASLASLTFVPLMRGSLVPVNLIETGRFAPGLIAAVRKAGQPLREIAHDPPHGYWAGVRLDQRGLEGAVSPNSLDGTAAGR